MLAILLPEQEPEQCVNRRYNARQTSLFGKCNHRQSTIFCPHTLRRETGNSSTFDVHVCTTLFTSFGKVEFNKTKHAVVSNTSISSSSSKYSRFIIRSKYDELPLLPDRGHAHMGRPWGLDKLISTKVFRIKVSRWRLRVKLSLTIAHTLYILLVCNSVRRSMDVY